MAHSALRHCLAALSFAILAMVSLGQATPAASLLVLSKQDHTMAIVDPATLKVLAKVPVGDDPHEIIASADGSTAYVSNYGFGRFHTLTVLDLAGQKQKQVIDLGALRGPHGLDFVDGKVWFTAEAAKAIGSYDPASDKVDWVMGTGQNRTHMIYVFPGREKDFDDECELGHGNHSGAYGWAGGDAAGPTPGRASSRSAGAAHAWSAGRGLE